MEFTGLWWERRLYLISTSHIPPAIDDTYHLQQWTDEGSVLPLPKPIRNPFWNAAWHEKSCRAWSMQT
jgi:hypothetical protein